MEGLPSQHNNPALRGDSSDKEISSGPVADREVARQDAALPYEDPYGWEAEIDRRLQLIGRSAAEFRGTRNAKRSLLHRVFHPQTTSRHR